MPFPSLISLRYHFIPVFIWGLFSLVCLVVMCLFIAAFVALSMLYGHWLHQYFSFPSSPLFELYPSFLFWMVIWVIVSVPLLVLVGIPIFLWVVIFLEFPYFPPLICLRLPRWLLLPTLWVFLHVLGWFRSVRVVFVGAVLVILCLLCQFSVLLVFIFCYSLVSTGVCYFCSLLRLLFSTTSCLCPD